MKKIINGKVYDTSTAKRLGEYEPSPYKSDFHWFAETLYKKMNGEFFIHGEGNAASKYSKTVGQNEWAGGEKIIPLTYEEAQAWAEKHLDGDDYISIFGEPDEDDSKAQIHINLPVATIAKVKALAAKRGETVSGFINALILSADDK